MKLPTIEELQARATKYGSEPYWFGLGFIQLKLSDTERMHFWLPEIPRLEREEIHNHRYDFVSTVLAGSLHHEIYHLNTRVTCAAPDEVYLGCKYEIFETNCAPGKEGTEETVTPCIVTHVGDFDLGPGSTYAFPHESFHTTEGTKFAITSLTRVLPKPLEFASVIKKRGTKTTCPFKDKIPAEKCWSYIKDSLSRTVAEDFLLNGKKWRQRG